MSSNAILDDIWRRDAKVVFCGLSVGKRSEKERCYYAEEGNRFRKVLDEAFHVKLMREDLKIERGEKIKEKRIGLTDVSKTKCHCKKGIEVAEGDVSQLMGKLKIKAPEFLAFNGRDAAFAFLNKYAGVKRKRSLTFGCFHKIDQLKSTNIYILPSTSGRNRWWDKKNHVSKWKELAKDAGFS